MFRVYECVFMRVCKSMCVYLYFFVQSICVFVTACFCLIKFVMCTLVSRDYVSFCKYVKHHVYPGDGERQREKETEKE